MLRVIEQSYEIIPCGTLEALEAAGRTAYKSEGKIAVGSAKTFVASMISRGHESVLEHYPLRFELSNFDFDRTLDEVRIILEETTGFHHSIQEGHLYLSMNARTLRDAMRRVDGNLVRTLAYYARLKEPELFADLEDRGRSFLSYAGVREIDDLYIAKTLRPEEAAKHIYRSVRFITDRGVTHELVRHRRDMAYTQESTRFCNYAGGNMTFIKSVVMEAGKAVWMQAAKQAELNYNSLIEAGDKPQIARGVLINALKTEIVVTTNLKQWNHLLLQRSAKDAHPQFRALAQPLLEDLRAEWPRLIFIDSY